MSDPLDRPLPEIRTELLRLQRHLDEAMNALRFYAVERHWWMLMGGRRCEMARRDDCTYGPAYDEGGAVARDTLVRIIRDTPR